MFIRFDFKPISVNLYYKKFRNRIIISQAGQSFRQSVLDSIKNYQKISGPISLEVFCYFSDFRKRDIDNILKPLIDCLKNNLFDDDDMIFDLSIHKVINSSSDYFTIHISSLH